VVPCVLALSGCATARLELELERARIDADQSRLERDRAMVAASAAVHAAERARLDAETRVAACQARLAEAQATPPTPPADRTTVVEGRFSLSDVEAETGVPLRAAVTVTVEGNGFMEDFPADPFGRIALELPAGRHTITVSAQGYLPQRFAVDLPTDSGELLLAATLMRRPGKGTKAASDTSRRSKSAKTSNTTDSELVDPWPRSGSPKKQRPKTLSDPFKRDDAPASNDDVIDPFGKR
jgi:hypothetical protein